MIKVILIITGFVYGLFVKQIEGNRLGGDKLWEYMMN